MDDQSQNVADSLEPPQRPQFTFFIDANAYLFLYEHYDNKLAELAQKLASAHGDIFITCQIVNEIERNKLRITRQVLDNVTKTTMLPSGLPANMPPGLKKHGTLLEEVRTQFKDTTRKAKGFIKAIKKSSQEHLKAVAESKDQTSQSLAKLYESAADHSAETLEKARQRKELGNPPGKRTDPIGDQISWEQLLGHIKENSPTILWVVTGDGDYAVAGLDSSTDRLLNPMLRREIKAIFAECDIRVFDKKKIASAFNDYLKERGKSDQRFSEEELRYYERLAERNRDPWECRYTGDKTPIMYGACINCDSDLPAGHGAEDYFVQYVGNGVEIVLSPDVSSDPVECDECGGTVFDVEFEPICSYCQHRLDKMKKE